MNYAFLMLLLPSLSCLALLLLNDRLSLRWSTVLSATGLAGGFFAGGFCAIDFYQSADYQVGSYFYQALWSWFHSPVISQGEASLWALRFDTLSLSFALTLYAASFLLVLFFSWLFIPNNSANNATDVSSEQLATSGYGLFFGFVSLMSLSVVLVVLASNLMLLMLGWSVITLSVLGMFYVAQPLVHAQQGSETQIQAFHAGKLWLVLGDALLVFAVIFLYYRLGTLDINAVIAQLPELYPRTVQVSSIQQLSVISLSLPVKIMLSCFILACLSKMALLPWQSWIMPMTASAQRQLKQDSYSAGISTRQLSLVMSAVCIACIIPAAYVLVRFHNLFAIAESLRVFLGGMGAISAILFALTALVKRQLSSVMLNISLSQLGLLVVTLSLAAWQAAVIHAVTLVAVMSLFWVVFSCLIRLTELAHTSDEHGACDQSNLSNEAVAFEPKRMKTLYIAAWLSVFGMCALPWASGRFFSQFSLLWEAWVSQSYFLYSAVLLVCFLTALVLGRLMYVLFHRHTLSSQGEQNAINKDNYNKLNSIALYAPILVLMVLVTPASYFFFPELSQVLPLSSGQLVLLQYPEQSRVAYYLSVYASLVMCLLGLFFVFYYYRVYMRRLMQTHMQQSLTNELITPLARWQQRRPVALLRFWLANHYGLEAAYDRLLYRPFKWISEQLKPGQSSVFSRVVAAWTLFLQAVQQICQSAWSGMKKNKMWHDDAYSPLFFLALLTVTVFMLNVI